MSRFFTDIFRKKPDPADGTGGKKTGGNCFPAGPDRKRNQIFEVSSMLSLTSYKHGSPEAKRLYSAIM